MKINLNNYQNDISGPRSTSCNRNYDEEGLFKRFVDGKNKEKKQPDVSFNYPVLTNINVSTNANNNMRLLANSANTNNSQKSLVVSTAQNRSKLNY